MKWLRRILAKIVRDEILKALAEYDECQAVRTEMVMSLTSGQTVTDVLKRFNP